MAAMVRVSPAPSTGITWMVVSSSFSPRWEVKASDRPSGAHTGEPSPFSPALSGRAGTSPDAAATQIWLR